MRRLFRKGYTCRQWGGWTGAGPTIVTLPITLLGKLLWESLSALSFTAQFMAANTSVFLADTF